MGDEAAILARAFLEAIVVKDRDALVSVLDPEIDFRGLTPSRDWRATTQEEVLEIVLGNWFEPEDHVLEVLEVLTEPIADRQHLAYRLHVENGGEEFLVEQQAFFDAPAGRITRMSVVCSGFRPWEAAAAG